MISLKLIFLVQPHLRMTFSGVFVGSFIAILKTIRGTAFGALLWADSADERFCKPC